jgi:hypothetical protein
LESGEVNDEIIWGWIIFRVSCETNFVSKQPKLVSKLSETRRLFRFNIKTGSFGVSIEPKQKENNRNKPKKVAKLF